MWFVQAASDLSFYGEPCGWQNNLLIEGKHTLVLFILYKYDLAAV